MLVLVGESLAERRKFLNNTYSHSHSLNSLNTNTYSLWAAHPVGFRRFGRNRTETDTEILKPKQSAISSHIQFGDLVPVGRRVPVGRQCA